MPKMKIKVSLLNEEKKEEYETMAILHENILKYREKDGTTVLWDYEANKLIRENNIFRMEYIFDKIKQTTGVFEIKELNQKIELLVQTNQLERKKNDIKVTFKVEENVFIYHLEEVK